MPSPAPYNRLAAIPTCAVGAETVGRAIRAEDGVGLAVARVQQILNRV